jgi:hypothetical protein
VIGERDLLVVVGSEPDFRWRELTAAMVDLAQRYGVTRLVTLGAVPAPMPHTRPVRVLCTTSDPDLLLEGDLVLPEDLVVPGAAVSVVRQGAADAGIPVIGYWAQVPHYLQSPFNPGILSLLERAGSQVGVVFPVGDLPDEAAAQILDISSDLGEREDAVAYVERLERIYDADDADDASGDGGDAPVISMEDIPTIEEIGAEIERFLRSTTDEG